MPSRFITLRDAEEIEEFFLEATGMKPGYLQLSSGEAPLRIQHVDIAGVTLIWTRARGTARWRDEMVGDGLHVGFAVECEGTIHSRGREVEPNDGQMWVPGKEMDLILRGSNLTLDIGIDAELVEQLGWDFGGEPLRRVSAPALESLLRECRLVTPHYEGEARRDETPPLYRRDRVLDALEPVLKPWMATSDRETRPSSVNGSYELIRRADDYLERLRDGDSLKVDDLARSLGVSRRSVFHVYREFLGVGPRRYLELRRVQALRARLKKKSRTETTVTSEGTSLGFSDMGRLAALYYNQYGEKPSETLNQA